ncbi:hypothetical protein [Chryseobacterium daeguense]|uniref:hypothetical protein n=1 Tax=Chryseobacterium daeguense TaxID=412438 RepID=UPI00041644EF|nr:hypothetical protein [Chryseobacterium daeguense]
MKYTFKFLQTGGVPLTNDLMALLEEAYGIFEVLGEIAGNLTILAGCEEIGSTFNPGIVAIEGKLYYFEGGLSTPTVYIHTEEIQETFQDQANKTLIEKRTVKFGNAVTTYNWADFVRLETLKDIQEKVNNSVSLSDFNALVARMVIQEMKTAPIQNGGIILSWRKSASEIPQFWKECTDTRGKILLHCDPNDVDFSNLGNTGGNKTITQTLGQMPKHRVRYTRTLPWASGSGGGFSGGGNQFNIGDADSSEVGGDQPMNIMNPYKIVLFIEPNFQ